MIRQEFSYELHVEAAKEIRAVETQLLKLQKYRLNKKHCLHVVKALNCLSKFRSELDNDVCHDRTRSDVEVTSVYYGHRE